MKKSELLIYLLNLPGDGCSYSAVGLAGKHEVSVGTIYRDINDLSFDVRFTMTMVIACSKLEIP